VVDRVINILKWPTAVVLVLLLPASLQAFWGALVLIFGNLEREWPFLAGFLAYWLVWLVALRRPAWGSWFSTLEHEFTHAIFAMMTGHRVRGLRTSWSRGGEISFTGRGNWLIAIAPYFFPTLTVLVALALSLVPGDFPSWAGLVLGLTISYHATSTYHETHREQEDLKRVGWIFAFAFLPAANVLSYGILLAFAAGGLSAAGDFAAAVWTHAGDTVEFIGGLFG
jgi:hypothetical protein